MSYLIPPEFKRFIQTDNLNQVINNDQSILIDAILDAQNTAKENLIQKFLISEEMTDTGVYDTDQIYVPGDRVYLDGDPYNVKSDYNVGDIISKDKIVYKNSTAISGGGEVWNPSHWTALGDQFSIWYVPYPNPLFDSLATYKIGDVVFRLGKTYTCRIATIGIDHTTLLQAYRYELVPSKNIFPEDPVYGVQYWGDGTVVNTEVTIGPDTFANVFPTGFVAGDNRDRSLVRTLINISLYYIHDRIAPRNIPVLRELRYKEAMNWLRDAKEGSITVNISVIQPRSGGRIRWGSNIRNINSY